MLPLQPCIFSVPRRKGAGLRTNFISGPIFIAPPKSPSGSPTTPLGPLDTVFASGRRATLVELLVVVKTRIDPDRFAEALRSALRSFRDVCGRREGLGIVEGSGVRFSAILVEDNQLFARPPPHSLFDSLVDDAGVGLLSIRLSHGTDATGIALCFDHALCDVSGPALLLAHISSQYVGEGSAPPAPVHERHRQAEIQLEEDSRGEGGGHRGSVQGGCGCVQWRYSGEELRHLKTLFHAHSKHDAAFADVAVLLNHALAATPEPRRLYSATVSRDDRLRFGLAKESFGNGIVLVEAFLPKSGDTTTEGEATAAAIRKAINGGPGKSASRVPADLHLNTWWHPLRRAGILFGESAPVFAIGPGTLSSAAQICSARGGQPNVTFLPDADCDGFIATLVVPLGVGHTVLQELKARVKANRLRSSSAAACSQGAKAPKSISTVTQASESPRGGSATLDEDVVGSIPSAVVWLHGLGDSSPSWDKRLAAAHPSLAHAPPSLHFVQPKAPLRNVVALGMDEGAVPAWFDMSTIPVTAPRACRDGSTASADSDPPSYSAIDASISQIHQVLDDLISIGGVDPKKIVLGGFSQGAAVALASGMSFPLELGGLVAISGWWPYDNESATNVVPANVNIPIHFSYGTLDDVVSSSYSSSSARLLERTLKGKGRISSLLITTIQRKKHQPNAAETKSAAAFVFGCLCQQAGPALIVSEKLAQLGPSLRLCKEHPVATELEPLPGGWSCHGENNNNLVDKLVAAKIITDSMVVEAFRSTDRAKYCKRTGWVRDATEKSSKYKYGPYVDSPQAIGFKVT